MRDREISPAHARDHFVPARAEAVEPMMPFGNMSDDETFITRFQRGGRQSAGSAIYEFLHTLPSDGPAGDPAVRKD